MTQVQALKSSSSESPDSLRGRKDCVSIKARYLMYLLILTARGWAVKGCVSVKARFFPTVVWKSMKRTHNWKRWKLTKGCKTISQCVFPSPAGMTMMLVILYHRVKAPLLGLNERWDCDEPNQNSTYPFMIGSYIATGKQPVVKRPTENESSVALNVILFL